MHLSLSLLTLLGCSSGVSTDKDRPDSADTGPPEASACPGVLPWADDLVALTGDIPRIALNGAYPSGIVPIGAGAFGVVLDSAQRPIVAASRHGDGRLVHMGHETLVGGGLQNNASAFFVNVLAWVGGESPRVGIAPGQDALAEWLDQKGYEAQEVEPTELDAVDVYIRTSSEELSEDEIRSIQWAVESGKGLVTGGHAWWWAQSNEDAASNHPGNHLLADMGLVITSQYGDSERTVLESELSALHHPLIALPRLQEHTSGTTLLSEEKVATAATSVRFAARHLPLDFPVFGECLAEYLEGVGHVVPTEADPLVPAEEPVRALDAELDWKVMQEAGIEDLFVHPAAADFPGILPDSASPIDHNVSINGTYAGRDSQYIYSNPGSPRWESTGLYAAPGEALNVQVPAAAVNQGLSLQIGAHSDTLWHKDSIARFPEVVFRWDLDAGELQVGSPLGGGIYVRVPAGSALGELSFRIEGAYAAPRFVQGETSLADWQNNERNHGAPWAELATDTFVLTLPAESVRSLEDPGALMEFWDEVLDASAELEGTSLDRPREERFVLDREISAGWMHSGYPLMGTTAVAEDFTNVDHLRTDGDWGPFHELGHNHQWRDWILPGTTEATCNLWSVYVMEVVVGNDVGQTHPAINDADRAARLAEYLANGADFGSDWSVWVALETHLQLQEAFGWEFFTQLFTEYRGLSPSDAPSGEEEIIRQWIQRTARLANANLGPFYTAWGFPMDTETRDALGIYPDWADDPMNQP